ncbi:MAG: TatD family hydrolase [Candidatus Thermoplasmatota archaeon]|nr:TatD family hydrolase [Candidatus Thermoplasmatota archaeon]MCL5963807.1 TatD family hydrolase [Candidatus Thermoplasmatota archaeon]
MDLKIIDNHMHLNPFTGRYLEAVETFSRAGGKVLMVTTMAYKKIPLTPEDYRDEYSTTVRIVENINNKTDVRAYAVIGSYPVNLIHMLDKMDIARASEIMKKGMDIASEFIRDGKAIGIGEIGWPHFEISNEMKKVSLSIFEYGVGISKDLDVPVIIHGPHLNIDDFEYLSSVIQKTGLKKDRIVKHYATPDHNMNYDIVPSYLAKKDSVKKIINQEPPFFLETDYMDDVERPGAVLDIATVPKRIKWLINNKITTEEHLNDLFNLSIKKVYGIEI